MRNLFSFFFVLISFLSFSTVFWFELCPTGLNAGLGIYFTARRSTRGNLNRTGKEILPLCIPQVHDDQKKKKKAKKKTHIPRFGTAGNARSCRR
mmetsp:Transcript_47924/g.116572  ORF Transcript_47924/g.116572 Transcript_47924/m.116572 type:complete len:94 (+) Transcript_47924:180-461(+)